LNAPRTQLRRDGPGGRSLGSVLLCLTQLGDGGRQRNQVRDERHGEERGVAADLAGHRYQPGNGAQPNSFAGRRGAAMPAASGAVVASGRTAQLRAAQGSRRDMQSVRRRPRGIRCRGRIAAGGASDALCGEAGLASRMFEDRVPFCDGAPEHP
jgi:hypothetical protein